MQVVETEPENAKEKLSKFFENYYHFLNWNPLTHKKEKLNYKDELFVYKILPNSKK